MSLHLGPSKLSVARADRQRVAVVGAGVAGLATAHLLADTHDVTLYEREPRPGGHARTVDLCVSEGAIVPVDVGFMVFNNKTYPGLTRLFEDLEVRTRTSDMSFSVSDGGDFEYGAHSPAALFANRSHLADRTFLRMVKEYVRFNREARTLMLSEEDPSLRGWLQQRNFSTYFIERLLVPQASAVWSADPDRMWSLPARFLVQFFDNHGMLNLIGRPTWRTVVGGSRSYVEKICARLGRENVRLGEPVRSVRRTANGIEVSARKASEYFDEVVLACHADQALTLLEEPTSLEKEVLATFDYQRSELALHCDDRLLPRRRAARASWNYHLVDPPAAAPTLTYDLKRLQGLCASRPILASLNMTDRIDPRKIDCTFSLAHPIFTPEAIAAQRRHAEISGRKGVHFAGAYWGWGFHEDGVNSACRVAEQIKLSALAGTVVA